jgi:hypothetical protein
MTRTRPLAAVVLLLTLSTGTGLAAADGHCRPLSTELPDVEVCETVGYLAGIGGDVGNLQGILLSPEEPTGGDRSSGGFSANVVAGSTFVDNTDPRFQHTVHGTVAGVLDTLEGEFYVTDPVASALGAAVTYRLRLTIDGRIVHDSYDVATALTTDHVGDDLAVASVRFTNLHAALERRGMDNAADTEHTILLEFTDFYYGDGNNVLWYDSAEAPSAITFNRAGKSFATTIKLT